ncbi:hypothetical protein SO694_00025161 [Aureococcus anophagefferens]|uniref:Uncharacterized protein n=1 Tax=Aureococcus anophagefferens TaxID=44056 RepID=A0ABR1FV46_AURAN
MASLLKLVRRYPRTSATAFASTRGFLGDAMAQKLEHDDGRGDFSFDGRRSATYVAWGCASALLYDYTFYSVLFPRWWPTFVGGQLEGQRVAKAVACDSRSCSRPLAYFPMFYVKDTCVAGTHASADALRHYADDVVPQNAYSLAYWTPMLEARQSPARRDTLQRAASKVV